MRGRATDGMRNRTEHERPAAAAARNAIKSRKCEKLQDQKVELLDEDYTSLFSRWVVGCAIETWDEKDI